MASVALHNPGLNYIVQWGYRERKQVHKIARRTLKGVGVPGTDLVEEGRVAYIIRRLCTDKERKLVDEGYLEIG